MNTTDTTPMTLEAGLETASGAVRAVEAIILSIIMVTSVVGNGSLWIVVLRTSALRTVTNMFILGLSLADLFVATFNMPFTVYSIVIGYWNLDDTACQVTGFTNMLTLVTSVLSLCNISINRYFMVVKPSRFKEIYTKKKAILMMIAVFTTSTLLSSLPLFGWCSYAYIPVQSFCFADWKNSVSYAFFMIFCCFGIPCVVMSVCNFIIFRTVRQSTKKVKVVVSESSSISEDKNRRSRDAGFDSISSSSGAFTSEEIDKKQLKRKKNKKDNEKCNDISGNKYQNDTLNIIGNGSVDVDATSKDPPIMHNSVVILDAVQSDSSDATAVELLPPFNRRLSYRKACEKLERLAKSETGANNKSGPSCNGVGVGDTQSDKGSNKVAKHSVNFDTNLLHSSWKETVGIDVPAVDASTDTAVTNLSVNDVDLGQHSTVSDSGDGSKRVRRKRSSRSSSSMRRREEIRLARSLAIIVVIFVLCWLPYCVSMVILIFLPESAVPRGFHVFTLLIGYANSMCNPIVYGIMNKRFKMGFKRLYCMLCDRG